VWKGALGKMADEINGLVGIVERALESRDSIGKGSNGRGRTCVS